ncbi:ABC-three component system protein [Virgibacillus pantothenticus]|uniref:ABC-three component system protein n=1 Tax=Virgibacillus pantothenticus TaxID=1473 RepID=UPI003D2C6D1E
MGKTKITSEQNRLSNTHVPDKVYAYSLQVRHALYELLNCKDNDTVSIEVLDDVSIKKDDGKVEAIQLKSVLSNSNPISNRAPDLWKTLYNWLLSVKHGELGIENTKFKLFLNVERTGYIVDLFACADNFEKAEEAWEKARLEFFDEYNNELSLGSQYALYIRSFFNTENRTLACKIIQKFSLQTTENNHTVLLYDKFCEIAVIPEDLMENVFIFMLGWVDKKTAELIEAGRPMSIRYKEFRAQLVAITREFNQKLSLKELAPLPTEDQIKDEYDAPRKYIKQLEFVESDYTDKLKAISDYLRASTNRSIWAKRGDISEKSLSAYEEELITKWENKKRIINLTHRDFSPEDQGKLLYLQCKDENVNVDFLSVPGFFTPGCYHALSDELAIGWHPDYIKLFKREC